MSKRKPHNQDAGYICEKIYKPSNSHIVVYLAKEQGLDVENKYAVVCSSHLKIVSSSSLPKARLSMKNPDFCADCMGL